MNSIPQSWISLPPPLLALNMITAWFAGKRESSSTRGFLNHPSPPPTNGKTKRKKSLHSFTWPEERRRRLAASCLDISRVLGLLLTLPNPLSSLKHPQGSAALHAEPCKAKNSEGHRLQPRPRRVPPCPEPSLPTANPISSGRSGLPPLPPTPARDPVLKAILIFLPPRLSSRYRCPSGRSYPVFTPLGVRRPLPAGHPALPGSLFPRSVHVIAWT